MWELRAQPKAGSGTPAVVGLGSLNLLDIV